MGDIGSNPIPATKKNKMQTAVEWLIEKMLDSGIGICKEWREQAKEMEKQQIEDAHIEGQRVFDTQPHSQWTNDQAEIYYNETYGSKGSDENIVDTNEMIFDQELFNYFSQEFNINLLGTEMQDIIDIVRRYTSSQTEISDEEIHKYAWETYSKPIYRIAFKFGAKWYREQLKKKQ